jgi:dTDP-4-dehydrorhamnose 3,5-epimerase/reductase
MDDVNFVIIGANGQLGTALQKKYPNARAVDSDELDITDLPAIEAFDWGSTTTILNAAAYTNVDGAESAEGRVAAWRVNAIGTRNLALIAARHDIALFHLSTEYVFDGTQTPHLEDEPFSPLGVYAQSKAAGEIAASLTPKYYIIRTSWLIGEGKNFVRTMLALGHKGVEPSVVNDQIGRLTFTSELVRVIDHLLTQAPAHGTYNVSNDGPAVSWADITREVYALAGYSTLQITGVSTADYSKDKPQSAPRPLQSTMDLSKIQATGFVPRDWREDLAIYIEAEKAKEQE